MKKRNIVLVYVSFLFLFRMGLGFIGGTYSNYLRSFGLDELQVNLVNVAFFITIFLFEIPTGIFADVFGRKKSFVMACFIFTISNLIYATSHSFWGFVTAEIIGAIAATFSSGAFQAWFVDRLKHYGHNEKLNDVLVIEQWASCGAGALCAVAGGAMADYYLPLPWIAGSVAFFMTGIIAVFAMREEAFVKTSHSWRSALVKMKDTAVMSYRFARKDKAFKFILLAGMVLAFSLMAPNMEWQTIFHFKTPKNLYNGLIMAGVLAFIMLGGIASKWLVKKVTNEQVAITISQIVIGIFIILSVSSGYVPVVIGFFLAHEAGRGMYGPIKNAYLNDTIPGAERATLLSVESMTSNLSGALGLVTSGAIAKYFGIPAAWIVSGGLLIVLTIILNRVTRQK
ncbi:MAG: MFS transporter [bacterium]